MAALAIGDILELQCPSGWGYLSYAGKDSTMGEAVWVVAKLFELPRTEWSELFSNDGYFVFYAAHTALRKKLVRKVGYSPEAIRMLPRLRRNVVEESKDGAVTFWTLTDGSVRVPKADQDLTDEERRLPVSEIWNHAYLLERLVANRPPQR